MDVGTPLLVQAEFSRLARDTVRPGYMRLTMEERLFYAHADQFVDSDLFDRFRSAKNKADRSPSFFDRHCRREPEASPGSLLYFKGPALQLLTIIEHKGLNAVSV